MNIVLSRDGSFEPPQAVVCESFLEAVQMAKEQAAEDGVDEVCVIGGARPVRDRPAQGQAPSYLTEVQAEVEGDVSFPAFDEAAWTEVRREAHPAGPDDDHAFVFRVLERR